MDNKKIGLLLSNRRKVLGLTQQQMGDLLNVSNKTISKWETGEGYPEITTIPLLCKALDLSTDDFFTGEQLNYESTTVDVRSTTAKTPKQEAADALKAFILSAIIGVIIVGIVVFLKL